jgi:hypothetical protein
VFLFAAAVATSALAVTLLTAAGQRMQWTAGEWVVPLVTACSFLLVFFFGRSALLLEAVARSRMRSLLTLAVWISGSLVVAMALTRILRPFTDGLGVGSGALVLLLACLASTAGVLDRLSRRPGRP